VKVFLEPNESLLFRNGRPFDAGETTYAETMFPPTPETLQGVIRAMIATHWDTSKSLSEVFRPGSDLVKLIGDRNGYGRFRITNISLGYCKKKDEGDVEEEIIERLYPVPAHILRDDKGRFRLKPKAKQEVLSNMPSGIQYLEPERGTKGKLQPIEGWLTEESLHKALSASEDLDLKVVEEEEMFEYEPRVGIGMENATKTTQEGLFYSMRMIRMRLGYGFVVDIRIIDESNPKQFIDDNDTQKTLRLPQQGWAILGGEQRAASFRVLGTSTPLLGHPKGKGQGSLIYLVTLASFKGGWKPEKWTDHYLPAPIAAAIPGYQPIGGWKLRTENSGGENKCMRRCVLAGSIYFFNAFVDVPRSLTDYDMEIGYGITATGEW